MESAGNVSPCGAGKDIPSEKSCGAEAGAKGGTRPEKFLWAGVCGVRKAVLSSASDAVRPEPRSGLERGGPGAQQVCGRSLGPGEQGAQVEGETEAGNPAWGQETCAGLHGWGRTGTGDGLGGE